MSWIKSTIRHVKAVARDIADMQNKVVNSQIDTIARIDEVMFDYFRQRADDEASVLPSDLRNRAVKNTYRAILSAAGSGRFTLGLAKYLVGAFYGSQEMKEEGAFMMMFGYTTFMALWNRVPSWLRTVIMVIVMVVGYVFGWSYIVYAVMALVSALLVVLARSAGRIISQAEARERLAFVNELYMFDLLPDDLARSFERSQLTARGTVAGAEPALEARTEMSSEEAAANALASAQYNELVRRYYGEAITALAGPSMPTPTPAPSSWFPTVAMMFVGGFIALRR